MNILHLKNAIIFHHSQFSSHSPNLTTNPRPERRYGPGKVFGVDIDGLPLDGVGLDGGSGEQRVVVEVPQPVRPGHVEVVRLVVGLAVGGAVQGEGGG